MEENKEPEVINNEENKGAKKKNNSFSISSLVFSLVGLLVAGLPCGIAAIVTGIMGLVKFKPEEEKGKGMAIAGIIVGAIDIITVIFYTVLKAKVVI